jgi:hypothetical protein
MARIDPVGTAMGSLPPGADTNMKMTGDDRESEVAAA